MIVSEVHGRAFNRSVADLVLSPSLTSSQLAYESLLIGGTTFTPVQIGGPSIGLGLPVPSYSGKHLRLVYDGAVSQDPAHTDATFSFNVSSTAIQSSGTGLISPIGIQAEGFPVAQFFASVDIYVPEFTLSNSSPIFEVAPFTSLFLNTDGSVVQSTGSIQGFTDNFMFTFNCAVNPGPSGSPTITVRTRRLFLEFVEE